MVKTSFWSKFLGFEHWNWKLFYGLALPYGIYIALKTKTYQFQKKVNTCYPNGGYFKENKEETLAMLPKSVLPISKTISQKDPKPSKENVSYPFVAKPLSGQRGKGISIINNNSDFNHYHKESLEDYMIQEFIDYPIELAVFYTRLPSETKGIVSSITQKKFLEVIGDGKSTLGQLINNNPRNKRYLEHINTELSHNLSTVLAPNESLIVEPIGNHCRGTEFIDARHLIVPEIHGIFDEILKNVPGFYYGRFDLKVTNQEDFKLGKNIKILELNGINADVAHIFQEGYPILQAFKDVWWHWKRAAYIAKENIYGF